MVVTDCCKLTELATGLVSSAITACGPRDRQLDPAQAEAACDKLLCAAYTNTGLIFAFADGNCAVEGAGLLIGQLAADCGFIPCHSWYS